MEALNNNNNIPPEPNKKMKITSKTNEYVEFIREQFPSLLKKKKMVAYNLKKLVDRELSQQEAIVVGHAFQTLAWFLVLNSKKAKVLSLKFLEVKKKQKEIDLLFEIDNELHYFEVKSNANLDTEKWRATLDKVEALKQAIQVETGKTCHSAILVPWYEYEKDMPHQYKHSYITFMSDFLKLLGYEDCKSEYLNAAKQHLNAFLEERK